VDQYRYRREQEDSPVGSLIGWGAVGGAGKGYAESGAEAQRQVGQEKHDSRQVQLQRQRDAAALERQTTADTAASKRQKEEWGEEGYRAAFEHVKAGIETTAASEKHTRDLEIERMRQTESTRRTRITEGESQFEWESTEEESVSDPFTGVTTTKPAERSVRDSSGTYIETGSKYGTIFVPATLQPPRDQAVEAGRRAIPWLISAPNRDLQNSRKFTFLQTYGYLPPEYFSAYDTRSSKILQSETERQPANQ
jgi:hypothetical protein